MSSPLARLALCLLLAFSAQSVCGSWQYTNGQTDTTPSGFTYQATVTENPANTFTGTAVLTAFSGTSAWIPTTPVTIWITVNTTDANGQPYSEDREIDCTVKGFSGFTLNSDNVSFTGDVNIIGSFNLNGNDMSVGGNVIHQAGWLSLGGGTLDITGDYLQHADNNGDGIYESPCNGTLYMADERHA